MNPKNTKRLQQLTPFERAQDNACYFIASCDVLGNFQKLVSQWKDNLGAWEELDWKNDKDDRLVLANIMKDQRELGETMIDIANKLEFVLGINA
jgi:hypothetical protein